MINEILSGISSLALRRQFRDDDGVDQLHHFVTVTILAFFAVFSGIMEFAGEPLNCWNYGDGSEKEFHDHVNMFCSTHNLYRYPNASNLSITPYLLDDNGARESHGGETRNGDDGRLAVYGLITLVFILQAFLFKLPNLFWSELNLHSGSNIGKMVEMLQDVQFVKEEDKQEKIRQVALFLEQWMYIHRKSDWFRLKRVSKIVKSTLSCCMLCIGNNISNFLSTLYLVVKALYLINNFLQFAILSAFLQLNFWEFGMSSVRTLTDSKRSGATTPTFPVVALCHFQTYDSNRAIGFWVQCVLNVNMFLEKIFLLEWFWLLMLLTITIMSFISWCFKILRTQTAEAFVHRYLKLMENREVSTPLNETTDKQFILDYLRNDVIFILRLLAVNTNDVVMAQLVEALWMRYIRFGRKKSRTDVIEDSDAGEAEARFFRGDHPNS